MKDKIRKSVAQAEFTVGGVTLVVHNLETGQRVIEKEGMDALLLKMRDGGLDPRDAMRAVQIIKGSACA